ncbi:hypothetical protein O3P69_003676 [Scylla paramamosain]|uniref:Uncharacterized protein n=1 Tax=Scylla paramamosain TaxID=85552 RepID=A0AAW0UJJ3_SCYPA
MGNAMVATSCHLNNTTAEEELRRTDSEPPRSCRLPCAPLPRATRLTTVPPLPSTRGQEAPEMTHLMHRARSLTPATTTNTTFPQRGHARLRREHLTTPAAHSGTQRRWSLSLEEDVTQYVAEGRGAARHVQGRGVRNYYYSVTRPNQRRTSERDVARAALPHTAGAVTQTIRGRPQNSLTRQDGWPASPTPIRPLPTTPTAHTTPFHAALNTPSGLHNLMARFGGLQRAGQSEACVIEGQLLIIKLIEASNKEKETGGCVKDINSCAAVSFWSS